MSLFVMVRSSYTTPKPSAIFLLVPQSPVTVFAENSFVALFCAFSKNKELVVK